MTLYGLGIGWRPEVSGIIAQLDGLAFCEVIAESVGNEIPPHLGSLGVPVIRTESRSHLAGPRR